MAPTCLLWVSGRDYKLKLRRWGGERNKDGLPSCGKVAAISTGSRRFSSPNSARDPPSQNLLGEQGVSSCSPTQGKVLSL